MTTDAQFDALRALFEQYQANDCWCGEGFEGVVAAYVLFPYEPDAQNAELSKFEDYVPESRPALDAAWASTREVRYSRLRAQVEGLLSGTFDEHSRAEIVRPMDSRGLVEFTNFWNYGDDYEGAEPFTAFLRTIPKALDEVAAQNA